MAVDTTVPPADEPHDLTVKINAMAGGVRAFPAAIRHAKALLPNASRARLSLKMVPDDLDLRPIHAERTEPSNGIRNVAPRTRIASAVSLVKHLH